MKKITLFLLMLTVSLGYSQVNLEDFDGATAPTVTTANGLAAAAPGGANIIANTTGSGTPGNVLEIVSSAAGEAWQQANLIMQNNTMDLTTDTTVQVDVYSLTAINVLSRVEDQLFNPATPFSTADAQHNGTGWETLTFDFTTAPDGNGGAPAPNGEYSLIAFFPSWVGGGAGNNGVNPNWNDPIDGITLLVDNITAVAGTALPVETCNDGILNNGETEVDCGGPNCAACPAAPTVAAPTPPARTAQNVISIFSDAYNDISVDTYDTSWCGATTSEVMVAGNATKQITGLGCEGVEFITGRFDSTGFGFFHMDIWTDTPTMDKSFNFKFSDWQGGGGEVGALEYSATNANILPANAEGTWISIELPLSSFTVINGVDGSDLVQFVITSDLGTVYYDNLYLHNNNLSNEEFASAQFKVYPNPTKNNWNIESNTAISKVSVFDILGKQVSTLTPNTNDVEISTANIKSGIYFARIEGINGSKTVKLIKE